MWPTKITHPGIKLDFPIDLIKTNWKVTWGNLQPRHCTWRLLSQQLQNSIKTEPGSTSLPAQHERMLLTARIIFKYIYIWHMDYLLTTMSTSQDTWRQSPNYYSEDKKAWKSSRIFHLILWCCQGFPEFCTESRKSQISNEKFSTVL